MESKRIIKIIIMCLLAIFIISSPLMAADIKFQWDAYTDKADGLIFYWSGNGETFHKQLNLTDTTYSIDKKYFKPEVEYSFWLTAWNKYGESGKSNIVKYTWPEFKPPADKLPTDTYEKPPSLKTLIKL